MDLIEYRIVSFVSHFNLAVWVVDRTRNSTARDAEVLFDSTVVCDCFAEGSSSFARETEPLDWLTNG